MEVQIFGRKNDAETRKAQRFFAERRVKVHFVDLQQRAAQPGELRRYMQAVGLAGLIDRDSKPFRDQGLAYLRMTDEQWLERLVDDPRLLRLPLVRCGKAVTVGPAEATWRDWVEQP